MSKKLDNHIFQSLLSSASPVNKARLLSVSAPHAGSWISVVPSTGLGLYLDPAECQTAIKWWLGLDTSRGSLCPFCSGIALDPLGHHANSCRHGGFVVSRHNNLRDTIANFCRQAHLSVQLEMGHGLSPNHSNSRPADILVQGWERGLPAAFDVSVLSPHSSQPGGGECLSWSALLKPESTLPMTASVENWCTPLAVESYGNWGMEAHSVFKCLASLIAIHQSCPKASVSAELYGHLNLSLVRSAARAILGREPMGVSG